MEVKINKEIREYTEGIFLGLSLRQCFFSFLACVMAVIFYFLFIDVYFDSDSSLRSFRTNLHKQI